MNKGAAVGILYFVATAAAGQSPTVDKSSITVIPPEGLSPEASIALKEAALDVLGQLAINNDLGDSRIEITKSHIYLKTLLTPALSNSYRFDSVNLAWDGRHSIYTGNKNHEAEQKLLVLHSEFRRSRANLWRVMATDKHVKLDFILDDDLLLILDTDGGSVSIRFGNTICPESVKRNGRTVFSDDQGFIAAFLEESKRSKLPQRSDRSRGRGDRKHKDR